MCIIVDANVANEFDAPSIDAKPVLALLVSKKLRMMSGGLLKSEIAKTKFLKLYRQLLLAGAIFEFDDSRLRKAQDDCDRTIMKSNDVHVIALAVVSGARLLFSRDTDLHTDFKNKRLLSGKKGRIYQTAAHKHVLIEGRCVCRR